MPRENVWRCGGEDEERFTLRILDGESLCLDDRAYVPKIYLSAKDARALAHDLLEAAQELEEADDVEF